MCDIQYEEFDNKERIYRELQDMILEGSSEMVKEDIVSETNLRKSKPNSFENSADTSSSPPKISELYSKYSKTFEEKRKTGTDEFNKEMRMKRNSIDEIIFNDEEESDISDLESIISNYSENSNKLESPDEEEEAKCNKPKMVNTETGTNENTPIKWNFKFVKHESDEVSKSNKEINKNYCESGNLSLFDEKTTSNMSCSANFSDDDDDDKDIKQKPKIKYDIKHSTNATGFSCNFGDSDEDEPLVKTISNMITTSTETDEVDNTKPMTAQQTFSTQADTIYHNLEQKILPFARNVHTIELKLKGRLSVFQRACVKQIADQNNLLMKPFGKGRDSFILLRKKITLLQSQKLYLEMKQAEKEKKVEKVKELKVKQEKLLNPPKCVSSGCQVDFLTPVKEEEHDFSNLTKNAKKKLKKQILEKKKKQLAKRNSGSQTVPEGYYVCPYCEEDLPEALQHIHYPYCLEKYRSNIKNNGGNSGISRGFVERKARSKSRDRIKNRKMDEVKKQLEKVHGNDINGILNTINDLEKKCSIVGCEKKKQKVCKECKESYCQNHFNPNDFKSDDHLNCPIVMDREEISRQKKLGNNNPLLKTVEELKTPKFQNGAVVARRQRRRQIKAAPPPPSASSSSNAPTTSSTSNSSNVHQSRNYNGPLLNYERNYLRKQLKEQIASLTDKRSK